jgi:predicted flap endonuclease-1-like 5' DNA nuclease
MLYLAQIFAPWTLAALALGLALGLPGQATRGAPRRLGSSRNFGSVWSLLALLAFIAGLSAAALRLPSGRAGFQLETALLFAAAYSCGYGAARGIRWLFARPAAPEAPAVAPAPTPAIEASAMAPADARPDEAPAPAEALAEPPVQLVAAKPAPALAPEAKAEAGPAVGPQRHDALYPGERPPPLRLSPQGETSDLAALVGIDPATEARLNLLGLWRCRQVALWSERNSRWIGCYLGDPDRVARERWVEQACKLVLVERV